MSFLLEECDNGRYDKTDNRMDTLTYIYFEDGRPQQVFCKDLDSTAVVARFEYDAGKSICIIHEQPASTMIDYKYEVEYSSDVKAADVECMENLYEFASNQLIRLFNINNID